MKFKIPGPLTTEHEELHEGQVLYPAAILVGEWAKARS